MRSKGPQLAALLPFYDRWRDHAACAGMPTDWWFVDTAKPDAYAAARGVCEACPVRQECLSYALEANERYGMWGGLSQDQRIKLKHRQALEAARRLA